MHVKTGDERTYGIYVRKVHPDSCVDSLESGDIIKRLEYMDSFWATKDAFNIHNQDPDTICNVKTIKILCYFDRYGDASVGIKDESGRYKKLIERKMSFSEIVDMIPIGADMSVEICRDQMWYLVESSHTYKESKRISRAYPRIEPIDYEIFAGLCCANLDMIHVDNFDNLTMFDKEAKNRYSKHVVICQVFPDTTTAKTQVLKKGHIIEELNGEKLETLEDIRKILRGRPNMITVKTKDTSYFMVSTKSVIPEDKRAMKNFNIRNHNYLLDSEQTQ